MGDMEKKRRDQYDLVIDRGAIDARTRKTQDRGTSRNSWYYFGVVGQIGFSIALPIAGGAIGGSLLDRHFGSYPRLTLGLLTLGTIISFITFYQTIKTLL